MKPALPALALLPLLGALSARADPKTLTLEQALQLAREHQPDILSAKAKTAVGRVEGRSAVLLAPAPGLGLGGLLAHDGEPGCADGPDGPQRDQVGRDLGHRKTSGTWASPPASSSGTSTRPGAVPRLEVAARATKDSEAAKVSDSLLSVRTAFFGANAGKALVKVAEESVASNRAHCADRGLREGRRPPGDRPVPEPRGLAKAELELVNAKKQLRPGQGAARTRPWGSGRRPTTTCRRGALSAAGRGRRGGGAGPSGLRHPPELKSLIKQSQSQAKLIDAEKGEPLADPGHLHRLHR